MAAAKDISVSVTDDVDAEITLFPRSLRRIYYGTSRNTYSAVDHYELNLCGRTNPYIILAANGIWWCVFLLDCLLFFDFGKEITFRMISMWIYTFFINSTLLIGIFFERPKFLLPFRIFCGMVRVFSLGLMAITWVCAPVTYFSVMDGTSFDLERLMMFPLKLLAVVFLFSTPIVVYFVFGVLASAATKCVDHMEAKKQRRNTQLLNAYTRF